MEDADPAVFISKQSAEAFLGGDDDYNAECNTPQEGTCVWWAVVSDAARQAAAAAAAATGPPPPLLLDAAA